MNIEESKNTYKSKFVSDEYFGPFEEHIKKDGDSLYHSTKDCILSRISWLKAHLNNSLDNEINYFIELGKKNYDVKDNDIIKNKYNWQNNNGSICFRSYNGMVWPGYAN